MVGAVPTIGYHFSEKEIIKEKSGYFLSWSLQGCSEPASQARRLAWILEPGLPTLMLTMLSMLKMLTMLKKMTILKKLRMLKRVTNARLSYKLKPLPSHDLFLFLINILKGQYFERSQDILAIKESSYTALPS